MVLKQELTLTIFPLLFENDVKMYGTQAKTSMQQSSTKFENDVKMYGTQA